MVDFYTVEEPVHKPVHNDPIHGLELTMAQYYSTLLSKIMNHVNDSDVHVTAEEKESWNNKADKSTVDDIKEIIDQSKDTIDNLDDTIKQYIEQYLQSDNFDTTILNNYATIKYVNDQLSKIDGYNIVDYAKKDWVNQNFIKVGTVPTFDSSKYYTKTEIDNKITSTGISYAITDFAFRDGKLSIVQENGINTSINIGSGSDTGASESDIISALSSYLKKGSLGMITFTRNGNNVLQWNPESGNANIDITGTGGGGSGTPGENGGTYVPYFKAYTSRTELPRSEWPTEGMDPAINGWVKNIAANLGKNQYMWMTQVLIKAGSFLEFTTPFCITGPDGEAGTDATGREFIYKRTAEDITPTRYTGSEPWGSSSFSDGWTDNPQGVNESLTKEWVMYRTMDSNNTVSEWLPTTGPVLWSHYGHNGTDGDGIEYIFASLKPDQAVSLFSTENEDPTKWTNDEEFQTRSEYIRSSSTLWKDDPIDIATTSGYGEGSKTYVSIRRRKGSKGTSEDTDAVWTAYSQPALWSYMAKNGEGGTQTIKGSPLRNRGAYVSGQKYYDGYTESQDGVFWQDYVSYNNNYYVCKKICTDIVPTNEEYWDLMSYSNAMFSNLLVANKASIGELTTNEVICTNDDNAIVAGMTSSTASVAGSAGNVRIWAGSTNTGNIQSAPFTVTDKGVLTSTGTDGSIKIENGTIWFFKGDYSYYLGIDDSGKPTWVSDGDAVQRQKDYYTISNGSQVTPTKKTLYMKNNIWHSYSVGSNPVNGVYYELLTDRAVVGDGFTYYISQGQPIANIYSKIQFTDGVPTFKGMVAITKLIGYAIDGVYIPDSFTWSEIRESRQVTNGFKSIYGTSGNVTVTDVESVEYKDSSFNTSSDQLKYVSLLSSYTSEQVYTGRGYSRYDGAMSLDGGTITIVNVDV